MTPADLRDLYKSMDEGMVDALSESMTKTFAEMDAEAAQKKTIPSIAKQRINLGDRISQGTKREDSPTKEKAA